MRTHRAVTRMSNGYWVVTRPIVNKWHTPLIAVGKNTKDQRSKMSLDFAVSFIAKSNQDILQYWQLHVGRSFSCTCKIFRIWRKM